MTEVRAEEHGLFTVEPAPDPNSSAERTRLLAAIDSGEPKPPTDLENTDALLRRITATTAEADGLEVCIRPRQLLGESVERMEKLIDHA